jgi:hypothetical protein
MLAFLARAMASRKGAFLAGSFSLLAKTAISLAKATKQLPLLFIRGFFLVFDFVPLGMSRHISLHCLFGLVSGLNGDVCLVHCIHDIDKAITNSGEGGIFETAIGGFVIHAKVAMHDACVGHADVAAFEATDTGEAFWMVAYSMVVLAPLAVVMPFQVWLAALASLVVKITGLWLWPCI